MIFLLWASTIATILSPQMAYDPLATKLEVTTQDTRFSYGEPAREVPLRIYSPKTRTSAAPVILFSHGLGGSRSAGTYACKHWAARGYIVVAMQHAGSDQAVMDGVAPMKRLAALKKAANATSAQARYRDVAATLDHLEVLNQPDAEYAGRFDLSRVGMCGHSFGAITTQAVSGQNFGLRGKRFTDKRIQAAVAFSPSPPAAGRPADAFAGVSIPWMLMTGTKDVSMLARTTAEKRQQVFEHLPAKGNAYQLVLKDAEHSAFGDERPTRFGLRKKRNPNHHRAIKALSTAFWDSYLNRSTEAKDWLSGSDAKTVLEPEDAWETK